LIYESQIIAYYVIHGHVSVCNKFFLYYLISVFSMLLDKFGVFFYYANYTYYAGYKLAVM